MQKYAFYLGENAYFHPIANSEKMHIAKCIFFEYVFTASAQNAYYFWVPHMSLVLDSIMESRALGPWVCWNWGK